MKAVSVISIVSIVVLIAISLTALEYIFFYRVFTNTATSEFGGINNSMSNIGVGLQIDAAGGNNVYIRNTGTSDLKNFLVYVNDVPVSFDINTPVLHPQEVATITINDPMPGKDVSIRVAGSGVKAYFKAHNMAFFGSCDINITQSMIPYTITQSNKLYCLNQSVYIGDQTAINFSSDVQNTNLDCQGHNINGNSAASTYGIYVNDRSIMNNTIKNCNVNNFSCGFYFSYYTGSYPYRSNNILTNNTVTNNSYGFYFDSSGGDILTNNTANNNTGDGFRFYRPGSAITITNNIANYNSGFDTCGFHLLYHAGGNTLTNNTANYNSGFGASGFCDDGGGTSGNDDNNFTGNTANYNYHGFKLYYSGNDFLTDNTINYNSIGIFSAGGCTMCVNNITGGSIAFSQQADYRIQQGGWGDSMMLYARNTNFIASRTITFTSATARFFYNNDTGDIWLKTNVSAAPAIFSRSLSNWSQTLMQWNDTSSLAITTGYSITGLLPSTPYNVYNNSVAISGSPFTSDSSGQISFTINLPASFQSNITVKTSL